MNRRVELNRRPTDYESQSGDFYMFNNNRFKRVLPDMWSLTSAEYGNIYVNQDIILQPQFLSQVIKTILYIIISFLFFQN
jgi:hypothetical protein